MERKLQSEYTLEEKNYNKVKEFCYLGSMIMTDAIYHKKIKRTALGKEASSKKSELLRGKLNQNLKR